MKNKSFFAFSKNVNPLILLDRQLNPFCHSQTQLLNKQKLTIVWTRRAQLEISKLTRPVGIEMQLYFSCLVKKRVIFTDKITTGHSMMTDSIGVMFNCVQANSCDPEEFAAQYPEKRILTSQASLKMHPKNLYIDYKNMEWIGEFTV